MIAGGIGSGNKFRSVVMYDVANHKSDYFDTADIPKIRNQLLRSSIELRNVLSSKPPSTLDANTTNEHS